MFISSVLWLYSTMYVNSFVLRDSYNIVLKNDSHYKLDQSFENSEFELIDKHLVEDKDTYHEFNRLARKEYDKSSKTPIRDMYRKIELQLTVRGAPALHIDTGTTTHVPSSLTKPIVQKKLPRKTGKQYDYDDLLKEYYAESIYEAKSNKTYRVLSADSFDKGLLYLLKKIVSFDTKTGGNKGAENGKSSKSIKCLISYCKSERQSPKALAVRIWKITKTWLFVYLAVAVPLWCTRGWCCCCLRCKFFKPRQTIDKAKKYLMMNPPGKFQTKYREVQYNSTKSEIECYEEFEHLMKTI